MKLYRAMCKDEFEDMRHFNKLSWKSKFKWFGTEEFVKSRVLDGQFNNSNFVDGRYNHLVEFDFDDSCLKNFAKCGHNEYMLNIRMVPTIKILNWKQVMI